LIGYLLTHVFVQETLPQERQQQFRLSSILPYIRNNVNIFMRKVPSWGLFKPLHNSQEEVSHHMASVLPHSQDKEGVTKVEDEERATLFSLWKRKAIRQHLLVYWIFSFLVITLDEVFPLYCISKTSGLGITERIIGNILSGTGLFYCIMQYFLLTGLVDRFGFYPALKIGTFFSVPLAILIPLSLITNEDATLGMLNFSSLAFLSAVYATIRVFVAVAISSITMTTNRTVPSHQRGTLNGLSMLGGSLAKALGPLFGGILFSTCVNHMTPPFGSVAVYGIMTVLGICLCVYAYFLQEYDDCKELSPANLAENENATKHCDLEKEELAPTF